MIFVVLAKWREVSVSAPANMRPSAASTIIQESHETNGTAPSGSWGRFGNISKLITSGAAMVASSITGPNFFQSSASAIPVTAKPLAS